MNSEEHSDIVICNSGNIERIKRHAELLILFLKETSKLTESYILDYFVEELWTALPASWLDTVMNFEPHDLEGVLDFDKKIKYKSPWPLSLLAFRESAKYIALPRKPVTSLECVKTFITENFNVNCKAANSNHWGNVDNSISDKSCQNKNIPEFCRRHVKPKKQHEIFRIGQLTSAILGAFDIKHILDIGSGQGHLSRFLSLYHNLSVVTVEANKSYVTNAENFDKQAVSSMKKKKTQGISIPNSKTLNIDNLSLPHHLEGWMTAESSKDFLNKIFQKSNLEEISNKNFEVWLVKNLLLCWDFILVETLLLPF